jgi:hypothetical protein
MISKASALALALFVAVFSTAPAWAAPPPHDPEETVVDDLVVTAKVTGPAWWRISKGDSVVWVIGIPIGLPRGFKWDTRYLDIHLTGAQRAITPAVGKANLFALPALLHLRGQMKSRTPLEDSLPPDLRARFLADARLLHQDPSRYDHWNALYAAFLMIVDFDKAANKDYVEPMPRIERAIHAHGVKAKAAALYKAMPILKEGVAELTPQIEQACMAEALGEIEGGTERPRRAAEGWARGDVRSALTAASGFDHCVNLLPEGARLSRQSMADEAGAIGAALDQPGVSVAVVPLRPLLAEGGVLEQLKARGYAIRTPDR